MGGLFGRRNEVLAVGPSGDRLLGAVEQIVRAEDPEVVVQTAGPGPWTAFYHQQGLLALARPSKAGPPGAIDVSVPEAGWAATIRDDADAAMAELRSALHRLFGGGGGGGFDGVPWVGGGSAGGIGALIGVIAIFMVFVGVLGRATQRRSQEVALQSAGGAEAVQVLRAARLEASIRGSSLSIGCLGSIIVGFVAFFVVAYVGAWLVSLSDGLVLPVSVLGLVPFVLAFIAFRWIRKRYPSPPRPSYVGWKLVLIIVGMGVAVALLFSAFAAVNR
jgi:hypothetical protein